MYIQPLQGGRNGSMTTEDETRLVGPDEIYEIVCWGLSIGGEQIAGDKFVRHLVLSIVGAKGTMAAETAAAASSASGCCTAGPRVVYVSKKDPKSLKEEVPWLELHR